MKLSNVRYIYYSSGAHENGSFQSNIIRFPYLSNVPSIRIFFNKETIGANESFTLTVYRGNTGEASPKSWVITPSILKDDYSFTTEGKVLENVRQIVLNGSWSVTGNEVPMSINTIRVEYEPLDTK